jgi:hypothetical protein
MEIWRTLGKENIHFAHVTNSTAFSIATDSYSSNGDQAISDTGTSFIYGPPKVIDGLASAVGAQYDSVNDLYTINCTAVPSDVIFTIGANRYNVNYRNYIIDVW